MKRVGHGILSKKQKGYKIIGPMKATVDKLC